MQPCFKHLNKEVSFLVCDYFRPQETCNCLKSIRDNAKFDNYQIIYFCNGAQDDYPYVLQKMGLVDKLIVSNVNEGLAFATIRMLDFCHTEYFINFNNDNTLIRPIDQTEFNKMKASLDEETVLINFSGCRPFSEKAMMGRTEFYRNIKYSGGSAGPFYYLGQSSEQSMLQEITEKGKKHIHWEPNILGDIGMYSIHETKTGGIYKRRNDTMQLWWIKLPTVKENILSLTDKEWEIILAGNWRGGTTPENSRNEAFLYYSKTTDPLS